MALSGSFTGTTSNSHVQPKITWSATQSVSGNYSDVTATLTYSRTNSGYTTSGKWNGSITINGTTTSGSSSGQIYITQNSNTFAMSATTRVYHNSDGTKEITISATGTIPAASLSSTSISGTVTLDTIPRAGTLDSLTCSTAYLDGTFTYKYTPKSSSFYNRLRVSIPDVVVLGYIQLGTKPASQQTDTYTISSALLEYIYNRYPNASTCTIGFVIETYSDSGYSTKVGESTELKVESLNFPEYIQPAFMTISWDKTSNEPDNWGMTQNVSTGTMSIVGVSTAYGSPIASYSLTFAGYSSTSSSLSVPNIASSGTLTAVARVTDTRGRFYERAIDFTVAAYQKPQITAVVYRCDASGNEDEYGEYMYVKASASVSPVGDNVLQSMALYYKRPIDTSHNHVWLESGTAKIVATSSDYSWEWTITANDSVNVVTANGSISTGEVVFDISADGKSIAFQKVAEHENAFEVGNSLTVGPIVGMNQLVRVPANSNANDYKTPGCYGVFTHGDAGSISNLPSDKAGILRVYSATGDGNTRGQYAYVIQEYHPMYADVFYKRLVYTSDASEVWIYGGWYAYQGNPV